MEDDDDRAYSAAQDADSTGPDEDELAETQAALDAFAAARDEALSEDDPHAADRKALQGNSLLWWEDTSLLDAFNGMADTFAEVLDQYTHAKALIAEGVPPGSISSSLELNFVTGPIVMGALQCFGLWVPQLREAVQEILEAIPVPEPTGEEAEMITAAYEAIQKRMIAELLALTGVEEDPPDPATFTFPEDETVGNAELGLDPN